MRNIKKLWDLEIRILARRRTIGQLERAHATTQDVRKRRTLEECIWELQGKIGRETEELETLTRWANQ